MKTIKIIDLLNMISKGEEVPKEIKHANAIYSSIYFEDFKCTDYENVKHGDLLFADRLIIPEHLNDEIEIIEEVEDKEYEDIEELNLDTDELLKKVVITAQDYVIEGKINALIRNQKKIIERLEKGE